MFRKRRKSQGTRNTNRIRRHCRLEALENRRVFAALVQSGDDFLMEDVFDEVPRSVSDVRDSPQVAYNALNDEYLVVYAASDTEFTETIEQESEVYGQLVSHDGVVRKTFRISDVSGLGREDDFGAGGPSVAWNSRDNEYLVTWYADDDEVAGIVPLETEIFGQRLDSNGNEIGENDFRISFVGQPGDPFVRPLLAQPVYNSVSDQYLVSYLISDISDGTESVEIQGQLLESDGSFTADAFQIAQPKHETNFISNFSVAASDEDGSYLAVWHDGLSDDGDLSDLEIHGQLINAGGSAVVPGGFQISSDQNGNALEVDPDVAFNPALNEFVVAWSSNGEIVTQKLDAQGNLLYQSPVQISDVDDSGDDEVHNAINPNVVFNTRVQEYLVTWLADDPDIIGIADRETEVFGQRLTATGDEFGPNDFLVTTYGDLGSRDFRIGGFDVALSPISGSYLIPFSGFGPSGEGVFGQMLELQRSTPISLEGHYNVDIVAGIDGNGVDTTQDSIANSGRTLVTDSLARQALGSSGNGLSDDGFFPPVHDHPAAQLDYGNIGDGPNAVRIPRGDTLRMEDLGGMFDRVYIYGFSDDANTHLEVSVRYEDGTAITRNLPFHHWNLEVADTDNSYTLTNGNDWASTDASDVENINDPAIYGTYIPTDASKIVSSVSIHSEDGNSYVMGVAGLGTTSETFVVTTADDESDGNLSADDLSLREALALANQNRVVHDDIVFSDELSGQTITLKHEELKAFGNIRIAGPGADRFTIDAGDTTHHFFFGKVPGQDTLANLSGVTLVNGSFRDLTVDLTGKGGALRNDTSLIVDSVAIRDSAAHHGGAIHNTDDADLWVYRSELSGNLADGDGGAVYNEGTVVITDTTISQNFANGKGGGLYAANGHVELFSVTATANHADFDNNASTSQRNAGLGGGVGTGAGGEVAFKGSIIADNFSGSQGMELPDDVIGQVRFDSRFNLIGTERGAGTELRELDPSNTVGGLFDPLVVGLLPLSDNGGPTRTHALRASSPAIDHAESGFGSDAADQRGLPYGREYGIASDAGAFEFQPDPIKLSLADAVANEGAGTIEFMVMLSRAVETGEEFIAEMIFTDSTAQVGEDYEFPTFSEVEFAAGPSLTRTISVELIDNALVDGNREFSLSLDTGAIADDVSAIGLIRDDDVAVFTIGDATVEEQDGQATFTIMTDTALDLPVDLSVNFTNGSASGDDFDNSPRIVRIEPGQTSATVSVAIADDDEVEETEQFTVSLSANPTNRNIDVSDTATGTIVDNDLAIRDWHNELNAYDVNGDGQVSALDALIIINDLSRSGARELVAGIDDGIPDVDVNFDGRVSALDALHVINDLSRQSNGEAEQAFLAADEDDKDQFWANSVDSVFALV